MRSRSTRNRLPNSCRSWPNAVAATWRRASISWDPAGGRSPMAPRRTASQVTATRRAPSGRMRAAPGLQGRCRVPTWRGRAPYGRSFIQSTAPSIGIWISGRDTAGRRCAGTAPFRTGTSPGSTSRSRGSWRECSTCRSSPWPSGAPAGLARFLAPERWTHLGTLRSASLDRRPAAQVRGEAATASLARRDPPRRALERRSAGRFRVPGHLSA